jgi:hypothetical protein
LWPNRARRTSVRCRSLRFEVGTCLALSVVGIRVLSSSSSSAFHSIVTDPHLIAGSGAL